MKQILSASLQNAAHVQKCFPTLLLGGELASYGLSLWAASIGPNAVLNFHLTNYFYLCKVIYLD